MELSERYIQTLEKEGFTTVYEHQDPAGTTYSEHSHPGKIAILVTDGSITYDVAGEKKEVVAGGRLNIPATVPYSAAVGSSGWIGIIGEE